MEIWGHHVAEWYEADHKWTPGEEVEKVRLQ
jgi:hypothetical protein